MFLFKFKFRIKRLEKDKQPLEPFEKKEIF